MFITKSLFVDYLDNPKMAWWKQNDRDTYDWIRKSDTEEAKDHIIQGTIYRKGEINGSN